ncbi:MAG: ABC transporter substrate-binding protein [Spirochaetes bacterium]|nr:ABC transporter substrate-binding protein [Spirochaetota bacterium]
MKKIIIVILSAALSACGKPSENNSGKREYTDMVGRTITVSRDVRKIFSTSPMGTTLAYSFDPELLIGWNYKLNKDDSEYMNEKYRKLPELGGWFGKSAGVNLETIASLKPDLIISLSTTSDGFEKDKSQVISSKTGIPVAVFNMKTVEDIPAVFEAMGELTGNKKRAEFLKNYTQKIINRAKKISESIPESKKVRIYYAEGLKGLNTEPNQSMHSELIKFCGGHNVAQIKENDISGYGNTPVSMEQVVVWNPEIILISDYLGKDGGMKGWNDIINSNPLWNKIDAVKNGKVYIVPRSPFQWIDRPPSVNRIAGLIWLPQIFYPELCEYDLKNEIKEFYTVFYGKELSDSEVEELVSANIYSKKIKRNIER